MEDLGTLGGSWSRAGGISQTGVVVGASETAEGALEVFLWTRSGGMRSLGSPGGNPEFLVANGVNTHRRVVGFHDLPFLWTPGGGIQQLPTLGGPNGLAWDINEFGQIVGTTSTAGNRVRATLWTPTAGPLAVSPAGAVAPAGTAAP